MSVFFPLCYLFLNGIFCTELFVKGFAESGGELFAMLAAGQHHAIGAGAGGVVAGAVGIDFDGG
jgi:hypothetical protein